MIHKEKLLRIFLPVILSLTIIVNYNLFTTVYSFSLDDVNIKSLNNMNFATELFKWPKGDKGDPGPPGPQGEKGDKGDPGPSKDLETITVSKTVLYGIGYDDRVATVECPESTKVTGGGYDMTQTANRIEVYENKSYNNGWMVKFSATQLSDQGPDSLTVYAQCGKLI